MSDPYAELVQFDEALTTLDQRVRGRMARVIASDGHMVTVELPSADETGNLRWDGPLGPYPATVANLPAGSTGVLDPLRGGPQLFVAVGNAAVVSHETAQRQGTRQSTTSISAYTTVTTRALTLLPGHWDLNYLATSAYKRSVATGGVALRITTDAGVADAEAVMVYDANVAGDGLAYMPISVAWKAAIDVPVGGMTITLTVEFRGDATAATTWLYGTTLTGHAIRTRPWG